MYTSTIAEFSNYLRAKMPTTIIYDDENNSKYKRGYNRHRICQPSYISLKFNRIFTESNTVILQCGGGYIRLSNVEKIQLDIDGCALGDIATIYCNNKEYITAYTLVIR